MAKSKNSKSKTKKSTTKVRFERGDVVLSAPAAASSAQDRITIMAALILFGSALVLVFFQHELAPYLASQDAQAAVRKVESKILDDFEAKASSRGLKILGWESQVFPDLIQVTYVYQELSTGNRKAFWWSYIPSENKVQRIQSVAQFVDDYLLPDIEQLHADVTGVPGPLARVRHQEETY